MAAVKSEERPLVVVLGASGYIGSAVTAELARRPLRLRLVARRPCLVHPPSDVAHTEMRLADLTESGAAARAVAGADVVVHLVAHLTSAVGWRAAQDDPVAERVNVGVMREVIAALRSGRPATTRPPVVVYAGSVSQAGRAGRMDGSERDDPSTPYARQKLEAEGELKSATADGVLRGISLRLPTVYGRAPGSPGNGVVQAMLTRALAGEALTMWRGADVQRELLHVADVARAFASCLDHADALAGGHWLIGGSRSVTVSHLLEAVAAAAAAGTGRAQVPVTLVEPPVTATAADFVGISVDSSAFRSVTGWRPRRSLAEGLQELVAARVRTRECGATRVGETTA